MQGSRRTAHLKDEVYRQMFRLEESRPRSELGLAIALLRAWIAIECKRVEGDENDWLRKVSPICLQMIEKGAGAATKIECAQQ